jgi:hypothetical protein
MDKIQDFNSFTNKDNFFILLAKCIGSGKKLYVRKQGETNVGHLVKRIELGTDNNAPYVVVKAIPIDLNIPLSSIVEIMCK